MDTDKAGLTQVNQSGFPQGFDALTPHNSKHFPIREPPAAIQVFSPRVESVLPPEVWKYMRAWREI